jgi:hypothetical protein
LIQEDGRTRQNSAYSLLKTFLVTYSRSGNLENRVPALIQEDGRTRQNSAYSLLREFFAKRALRRVLQKQTK